MSSYAFLRSREWRRQVGATALGKGFWGFLAVAVLFGALCWLLRGPDAVAEALFDDLDLITGLIPRILVALSVAALIWVLLPRHRVAGLVGHESGLRGLLVATLAGAVTPGGPSSAFPLLSVMAASGADRGALVAYITAWSTLGLQRVLTWEVPFLGPDFAILRVLVCLPLPLLAGLLARRLPFELTLKDSADAERREAKA